MEQYRMTPSELNRALIALIKAKGYWVDEQNPFFNLVQINDKKYVIFNVMKDAESKANEPDLDYFIEKLIAYYQHDCIDQATVLIALRLCRGFLKIPIALDSFKRKHIVLVEISPSYRIQVHDSGNSLAWGLYPDKIEEKINVLKAATKLQFSYDPQNDYHIYNNQKDQHSCGYAILAFIHSILENGHTSHLKDMQFSITDYETKNDYYQSNHIPVEDNQALMQDHIKQALIEDDFVDIELNSNEQNNDTGVNYKSTISIFSLFRQTENDTNKTESTITFKNKS